MAIPSQPSQPPQPEAKNSIDFGAIASQAAKITQSLDLQKTWGIAHVSFVALSAAYFLNLVFFSSFLQTAIYRLSMLALMVGYGIAVKRHVGHFGADLGTMERAFSYDGTPYFALSLMWWMMAKPIPITLLPLACYSVYHAVAWAKEDGNVKRSVEWKQWGEALCLRLSFSQAPVLFIAAHLEVAALPYMILSWLLLSSSSSPSILQIIFYVQFLRWQYTVSPKIRSAVKQWVDSWEQFIQHPSCPKNLRNFDRWARKQLTVVNGVPTTQTSQRPGIRVGVKKNN